MKHIKLFFALSIVTFNSYGQSLEFTDRVLDKMVLELNLTGSEMVTKEMHQELQLTPEQYETVELVNNKRFQQILKAEEKYAGEPALLEKSYKEINTNSVKVLSSVLTEEQLKQFIKLAGPNEKKYFSINQDN
ncbi:hypothetical protein [Botryobacter ruber]|uniref:hypothetical protein n=1 Tax=Botryobacter ruber TaxID=2171629 RepID=UPI000E0C809C|nr:hypothetical protein [Botryobacter ruber]